MEIKTLIASIGQEFGLSLKLNENNVASLVIDDKFDLELEYVDDIDTLFISSPLGKLTGDGNGFIYKSLLDANLYGKGTGGSIFAIDERTDEIILFFKLEVAKTEYDQVRETLERYLNIRTEWISSFERIIEEHNSRKNKASSADTNINFDHAIRI